MKMRELTNEEFNNFTKNFKDKSIYQTTEYAFIMNKQDFDSVLLGMVDDNDNIVAATLILIEKKYGFKYAYSPRGFLIDYTDFDIVKTFTSLIKKYLGKLDIIAIKVNPIIQKRITNNSITIENKDFDTIFNNLKKLDYYHLGFNNSFEALKPRFESVINLDKNYVDIFNNLPKSLKTKIRSAEKNGIIIHKGNMKNLEYLYFQTKNKYPRDLNYFKDCYEFFGKEKNAEFYYAKIETSIFLNKARKDYQNAFTQSEKINAEFLSNPDNNKKIIQKKMEIDNKLNDAKNELITATKFNQEFPNGIIIASVLVIKQGTSATLLMDGYDPAYKKYNGKHLLIWKLIEKFSKEGITEFNLGGINNPENPQTKYTGLTSFKLNFGSEVVEYIGDLELITNKPLYFMYRNSAPLRKMLKR